MTFEEWLVQFKDRANLIAEFQPSIFAETNTLVITLEVDGQVILQAKDYVPLQN